MLPVGALVGIVLLAELMLVVGGWVDRAGSSADASARRSPARQVTNTEALGHVLYTRLRLLSSRLAGLMLLVAMIGAIVLTLRHKREGVKRQIDRAPRSRARRRRRDRGASRSSRGGASDAWQSASPTT